MIIPYYPSRKEYAAVMRLARKYTAVGFGVLRHHDRKIQCYVKTDMFFGARDPLGIDLIHHAIRKH